MTDKRLRFLKRVRLRMRLAWLAATAQRLAPLVGLGVVVALALEWLTPFEHGLLASGLLIGAFALVLTVSALVVHISPWDASRAAERGLDARDALTTALEFDDPDDDVHQLIQRRADQIADASQVSAAIPIHADGRRVKQVMAAGAIALLIGILPQPGASTALSADDQAALDNEAEQVDRIADAVEQADVGTSDEIVSELRRLAEELRTSETLEQALQSIQDAEKRLDAKADPDFLSQKAAVQGLARDLSLRPLTDGALDASSQFERLASSLDSMSDQELSSLSDRLADLAESQSSGNPELSDQLSEAARALAEGDLADAASLLLDASTSSDAGLQDARGQQALTETRRALDGVQTRLGGAGVQGSNGEQGQGQGEGGGQGEGQGQGLGQAQGSGGGDGQSQSGAGSGGQPADGAGGIISGVTPGDGNAAGTGAQGQVGAGGQQDHSSDVKTADIFSPIDPGALADLVQIGIAGGTGDGDILGRANGPTIQGESVVPYAQVLPQYLNQAADALSELRLPPSMRTIVQTYFNLLAAEVN